MPPSAVEVRSTEIFEHFHEDNAAVAAPGKKYVPGAVGAAVERKLAGQMASAHGGRKRGSTGSTEAIAP